MGNVWRDKSLLLAALLPVLRLWRPSCVLHALPSRSRVWHYAWSVGIARRGRVKRRTLRECYGSDGLMLVSHMGSP